MGVVTQRKMGDPGRATWRFFGQPNTSFDTATADSATRNLHSTNLKEGHSASLAIRCRPFVRRCCCRHPPMLMTAGVTHSHTQLRTSVPLAAVVQRRCAAGKKMATPGLVAWQTIPGPRRRMRCISAQVPAHGQVREHRDPRTDEFAAPLSSATNAAGGVHEPGRGFHPRIQQGGASKKVQEGMSEPLASATLAPADRLQHLVYRRWRTCKPPRRPLVDHFLEECQENRQGGLVEHAVCSGRFVPKRG
jgi:hypothetical protein